MQIKVSDLKPGDIIPANNNPAASHGLMLPRLVVLKTEQANARGYLAVTVLYLDGSGELRHGQPFPIASMVDVERAQEMTNAQKHGELLLGAVKKAVGIMGTPEITQYARLGQLEKEWLGPAKTLIATVEPPPPPAPTLAEALAALDTLEDGARKVQLGEWDKETMQTEREKARALLNRARAAGVLK